MKFQNLGLRENPKSHRKKMVTFVGKQMRIGTSKLNNPQRKETPFVAICIIESQGLDDQRKLDNRDWLKLVYESMNL